MPRPPLPGRLPAASRGGRCLPAVAALLVVTLTPACSTSISPAEDLEGLARSLQEARLGAPERQETNALESRFFSVPGVALVVPGRRVLAFEFADQPEAAAQAALVSPDGSGIGNKYIGWQEPPRFFARGRLIVIYQGDDRKVLDALEKALGPQFAGERE